MCVIAVKYANQKMFKDSIITNMFANNGDGAGYMYAQNGVVHIHKGFMDLQSLLNSIHSVKGIDTLPVIIHCRIATHGGIKSGLCHPFPLSDEDAKITALNLDCNVGIAHNGIISNKPRAGWSDTAEYIATQVVPLSKICKDWMFNRNALDLIEGGICGSRMAFINGKGKISLVGDWVTDGEGHKYSNRSYSDDYYRMSYHYYTKPKGNSNANPALNPYLYDEWDDGGWNYVDANYDDDGWLPLDDEKFVIHGRLSGNEWSPSSMLIGVTDTGELMTQHGELMDENYFEIRSLKTGLTMSPYDAYIDEWIDLEDKQLAKKQEVELKDWFEKDK